MTHASIESAARPVSGTRRSRIALVDDHPLVREGMARLLEAQGDLSLAFDASTAVEALAALASGPVELLVTDLSLREGSGLELVREASQRWPALPVLVLSMHEEQLYAERALRAGAKGFVMKHEPPDVFLTAIRRVLGGEVYLSAAMSGKLLHRFVATRGDAASGAPLEQLSDRELEVFQLIGQGLPNRTIAERLFVSIKTVESHRERMKQKLGLAGGAELLRYAIEHALGTVAAERRPS
jgi:DNA-binding NarL/FixJ family response regulator